MESQFTEILIEREDDTILGLSSRQYLPILTSRRIGTNPQHFVAVMTHRFHGLSGHILVR